MSGHWEEGVWDLVAFGLFVAAAMGLALVFMWHFGVLP